MCNSPLLPSEMTQAAVANDGTAAAAAAAAASAPTAEAFLHELLRLHHRRLSGPTPQPQRKTLLSPFPELPPFVAASPAPAPSSAPTAAPSSHVSSWGTMTQPLNAYASSSSQSFFESDDDAKPHLLTVPALPPYNHLATAPSLPSATTESTASGSLHQQRALSSSPSAFAQSQHSTPTAPSALQYCSSTNGAGGASKAVPCPPYGTPSSSAVSSGLDASSISGLSLPHWPAGALPAYPAAETGPYLPGHLLGTREEASEGHEDETDGTEEKGSEGKEDDKKRKRLVSNCASAKRSRQRKQDRLQELELVSAKLRVEHSETQRRLSESLAQLAACQEENEALKRQLAACRPAGNGGGSLCPASSQHSKGSCKQGSLDKGSSLSNSTVHAGAEEVMMPGMRENVEECGPHPTHTTLCGGRGTSESLAATPAMEEAVHPPKEAKMEAEEEEALELSEVFSGIIDSTIIAFDDF